MKIFIFVFVVGFLLSITHKSVHVFCDEAPLNPAIQEISNLKADSAQLIKANKALSLFMGTTTPTVFNSTLAIDVPVAYHREGLVSPDVSAAKNLHVGRWVHVEGIGLIQIVGVTSPYYKNTIRLKSTGSKHRSIYQRKVRWMCSPRT